MTTLLDLRHLQRWKNNEMKWLAILLHISEVNGFNFNLETALFWVLLRFSLIIPTKQANNTSFKIYYSINHTIKNLTVPSLWQLVYSHSMHRPRFNTRPFPVEFLVDNVALGQVYLQVLLYFSSQYHSTNAASSFVHLSLMFYHLSHWFCH